MRTAERRDHLLNLLHGGATTAPDVARNLGVSERTVYRDLAWLRAGGHDIQATPGPGGGVRMGVGSRLRSVHFDVAEVIGLALAVATLRATPHTPFAGPAEAALRRARKALPVEKQRALRWMLRRILVGHPCSERVRQTLGPVDSTLLAVVERCFSRTLAMGFDYVDGKGVTTSRRVECVALVLHNPTWYVLAWDLDKDDSRLFRMDRISTPTGQERLVEQHAVEDVAPAVFAPDVFAPDGPIDEAFRRTPVE